jgi:SnoaL-like domain
MTPSPPGPIILPPLLATYVEATNSFDLSGLLATFADDALVNDQLRDHWGRAEIREWAKRDIVGKKLTLDVTDVIEHYGNFVVTAKADGHFDKRGLPNPFVLALYFTVKENRIVQLMILPSGAYLGATASLE